MQISPIAAEFIANGGFPVKHLSYSSMKQYLQDPRGFLKKYVRYEFDDTTSPAYLAGLAVHKALELYFTEIMTTGEVFTPAKVKELAIAHLDRLLQEKAGKAFSTELDKNGITFAWPNFAKEIPDDEIIALRKDAEEKLREFYGSEAYAETTGGVSLEGDALDAVIAELSDSLVKWGKSNREEAEKWASQALDNYFENEPKYGKPVVTERFETVVFQDETGVDMPIPLKVGVDRIDLIEDGKACEIIDYKTIDKFTEDEAEKTEYELQGVANYFAAQVITGVTPRRMIFLEILKDSPGYEYPDEPNRPLLKDDLLEIAKKHGVEFAPKTLVADMKTQLVEAGVFKKKPGVKPYVIEFDERHDAIAFFLALYKGVVTMIAVSEMFGIYLPNIFERFGGLESARDFKEFEAVPRELAIKKLDQVVTKIVSAPEPQLVAAAEEIDTF